MRDKTQEFIEKAKKIHGDKYDYSKVVYVKSDAPVTIICPIHGEFQQIPSNHIRGWGCNKCANIKRGQTFKDNEETFLSKAKMKHGDKYDYSLVKYVKSDIPIEIICPKHGVFRQIPSAHLAGQGCPKCKGRNLSREDVIELANKVHNNFYDYSEFVYHKMRDKTIIICPIHGRFEQCMGKHLRGQGCPECAKLKKGNRSNTEKFIEKAKKIHGDKYDYSKTGYIDAHTPLTIICPIHGEFEQIPNDHLQGHGCPKCSQSHLEKEIALLLESNGIEYEYNKKYKVLNNLQLDFFIPSLNIGIECQGEQHFEPIKHFGGKEHLKEIQKRDLIKKELCEKNEIKLLYYSNLGIKYPYEVIEDKNLILEEILMRKH